MIQNFHFYDDFLNEILANEIFKKFTDIGDLHVGHWFYFIKLGQLNVIELLWFLKVDLYLSYWYEIN
jgi:hypothetical protein